MIPATIAIKNHDSYECIAALIRGEDWTQTREYVRLTQRIAAGMVSNTKGLTTVAEVDDYFEGLRRIVADIAQNGYRSQGELKAVDGDEIRVVLLEDRTYAVVGGGTHRLAAAHLLGVPSIPVIVKAVATGSIQPAAHRSGAVAREVIEQLP